MSLSFTVYCNFKYIFYSLQSRICDTHIFLYNKSLVYFSTWECCVIIISISVTELLLQNLHEDRIHKSFVGNANYILSGEVLLFLFTYKAGEPNVREYTKINLRPQYWMIFQQIYIQKQLLLIN